MTGLEEPYSLYRQGWIFCKLNNNKSDLVLLRCYLVSRLCCVWNQQISSYLLRYIGIDIEIY